MIFSSLKELNHTFTQVIANKSYVGREKENGKNLTVDHSKSVRLAEIFAHAQTLIQENLKQQKKLQKEDFVQLRALENNGKLLYKRYEKSTQTWKRTVLKGLAFYTPEFFKRFLPSCFSNQMAKAEKDTQKSYDDYIAFIRNKLEDQTTPAKDSQKPMLKAWDEDGIAGEIFNPYADDAPKDKAADKEKQDKKDHAGGGQDKNSGKSNNNQTGPEAKTKPQINTQGPHKQRVLNQDELKKIEERRRAAENRGEAQQNLSRSQDIGKETITPYPDSEDHLLQEALLASLAFEETPTTDALPEPVQKELSKQEIEEIKDSYRTRIFGIIERLNQFGDRPLSFNTLKSLLIQLNDSFGALYRDGSEYTEADLIEMGLNKEILDVIKNPDTIRYLLANDNHGLIALFADTPWEAALKEASEQKETITFGYNKTYNKIMLSKEGKQIREGQLVGFRGQFSLTITNSEDLLVVDELVQFMDKNKCRPHTLLLKFPDPSSLPKNLIGQLSKLAEQASEITIEGIMQIDFEALSLDQNAELYFIRNVMKTISFSQLTEINLPKDKREEWAADDYSLLCTALPTMKFLQACFAQYPDYRKIILPDFLLSNITELDLTSFSVGQIAYILPQLHSATHLNFSGHSLNDAELISLLELFPSLDKVTHLNLTGCPNLTTDSLFVLTKMNRLKELILPELPEGVRWLGALPRFNNPFKIKTFYLSCDSTRKIATSLYTGPQHLAALFQIPLAQLGEYEIFPRTQKAIDPKSLAYWLHEGYYMSLLPQHHITSVIADSNAKLQDDDIDLLLLKFPKTEHLSLYNCPNITDKGVVEALKQCPNLKTLDLTGCRKVKGDFIASNTDTLKKLDKLILSGTLLTEEVASLYRSEEIPVVFEESILKIRGTDFSDEKSFEELLLRNRLNHLKEINLEGCTELTDTMLAALLNRFNADAFLQGADDTLVDNPQRINAAVLNLKGCHQITEAAFRDHLTSAEEDGLERKKYTPKILESLERVVIDASDATEILTQLYPMIAFQAEDLPDYISIVLEKGILLCKKYHELKKMDQCKQLFDKSELNSPKKTYMFNRIALELFADGDEDVKRIKEDEVNTDPDEYRDMTLFFSTSESEEFPSSFQVHGDLLYTQSEYFRNEMRPGNTMRKKDEIDFINANATEAASKAILNLINGTLDTSALDWETAGQTAELIGPNVFRFDHSHYIKLLRRMLDCFTLENAADLMAKLVALNAKDQLAECEVLLEEYLEDLDPNQEDYQEKFNVIRNLAGNDYGFTQLSGSVTKMQEEMSQQIIRQYELEQEVENHRLEHESAVYAAILEEEKDERQMPRLNPWHVFTNMMPPW